MVEEKVNLSQEKREKKMVSNIIDVSPDVNRSKGTYNIGWKTSFVKVMGKNTKIYNMPN